MTLDLSALTVEDSDETLGRKPGAGRPKIDNPFGAVIMDSWTAETGDPKTGKTKVLTVENDKDLGKTGEPRNVTTIKGLIRRAAEDAGLGVKIVIETVDGNGKAKDNGRYSKIKFAAKEKTARTRQAETVENPDATGAEMGTDGTEQPSY